MNEHTVLCVCLLQWVRMEAVSYPESWRSTAPVSNRKCILIIPRQSQHKRFETSETLSAGVWYLLVFPSPSLGWEAAVAHLPVPMPMPLRIPKSLLPHWRHRLCVPDTTQQINPSILSTGLCFQQPEGRLHTEATRVSGQPLALCCWWPRLRTGRACWGCSDVTKCGNWLHAGVRLTLCCMMQISRENFFT